MSQITYELIKSQADKLTQLFVKKRPGFRMDFIAQRHPTEKIIFVIQTDEIFSTIRIDMSNDQSFPLGLQISTQVFVNEGIKFVSNPHRAVVTERLVLAMDSLLPVLLAQQFSSEKYPNPKLALKDEWITIG